MIISDADNKVCSHPCEDSTWYLYTSSSECSQSCIEPNTSTFINEYVKSCQINSTEEEDDI